MRGSAVRVGFHLEPGMRVGLYGGSFNPAHEGHAHVANWARKRLGLQKVIWLVSPQNPLKRGVEPTAPLAERMAGARRFARGPSMIVSDAETRLGTSYTVDTIRALKRRFPGVRFFWIMGSDNLAIFHRWRAWRTIARLAPIVIVDRPGSLVRARFSPAGRRLSTIDVHAPLNFASSTALRTHATVKSPRAAKELER